MSSLFSMWQEGGFAMYPTLMFGLLAVVCGVASAIVGHRVLFGIALALTLLTMITASVGTVLGRRNVDEAVVHAMPEDRETITKIGYSEAMRPVQLGGGLMMLAFPLVIVGFLRSQPKPQA